MADTEFPGGGGYDHVTSGPPGAPEMPRDNVDSSSPLEAVTLFVTEAVPNAIVEIIEAVHEHFQSPEDLAKEHMDHVTELHQQMIEHLSAGDVDGAAALNAQAESELSSAVMHLQDPNYREAHHNESHGDDSEIAPVFFPQQMDSAPQLPGEYGHVDDHVGHG